MRKRGVNPLVIPLKDRFAIAVDIPNRLAELKSPDGLAKLGWFNTLKESARIWKVIISLRRKGVATDKSN